MSKEPFIVSVSRRTDVAAFYSEWFLNRARQGRVEFVHPYSRERFSVELDPTRVAALVFWTKDFRPLLAGLAELEALGFNRYLVHYTITGLGPAWEPRAPAGHESMRTLGTLADRIGPERVLWRFDPMVITERISTEATISRFARLCRELKGATRRCLTSLFQPYAKTGARVRGYEQQHHDRVLSPGGDELAALSLALSSIAGEAGITVQACCTPALVGSGVQGAHCVDGGLILSLWPDCGLKPEPAPTRRGCGCDRSIDLGAYDTCPHQCLYCYANCSASLIEKHHRSHRPEDLSLVG